MIHKKDLGKMGEALIVQQCLEHGLSVFIEFGDNSMIDLIVEDSNKKLHRIQVKVCSRPANHPHVTTLYLYKSGPNYRFTYTSRDVDWFAVVDVETKKVAWVPSTICDERLSAITMRHESAKNKQTAGIRMFDDYTEFPFSADA